MKKTPILILFLLSFLLIVPDLGFARPKNKPKKAGKIAAGVSADPENLPDALLSPSPIENVPASQGSGSPKIQEPDGKTAIGPTSSSWDKTRDIFSPGGKSAELEQAERLAAKMRGRRLPELQGILNSSDKDEMAIINNQMVRKGSEVDGFRVVKINKNSVVLNRDGEEIVLNVKQ